MILANEAILKELKRGKICVYDEQDKQIETKDLRINSNSIDLTLSGGGILMAQKGYRLTAGADNSIFFRPIPAINKEKGKVYELQAGLFYLASTAERIDAPELLMQLHGKSSRAREGLSIHEAAGFGDVGFNRQWTLEIAPKTNIVVPVGLPICQVAFHRYEGKAEPYAGRYQNQRGATPAKPEGAKVL